MPMKSSYLAKRIRRVAAVLLAAAVIGALSALVADTLKVVTEHYEHAFF
jgi:CIC family chloride channel protein